VRRRRDDGGQVGGVEILPFGVLIFVVGTLLVANVWAVVDAKLAVDAAAREATRQYVEAGVVRQGDESAAAVAARDAGLAALAEHGRDPSRAEVWRRDLTAPTGEATYVRCARVTFSASYEVPALTLPWIGGYGHGFEVVSNHSELVDPYRDGVPGDAATC
jgi:hypothetical protein